MEQEKPLIRFHQPIQEPAGLVKRSREKIAINGEGRCPGAWRFVSEAARMKMIQTTIEVDEQRKATIQLPADVSPGPYQAVVVIEHREPAVARAPLTFSAHDVGPWPEGFTVRREEIYGDDGR
jgi:hypothetical protein